jgi:hypothetical protein
LRWSLQRKGRAKIEGRLARRLLTITLVFVADAGTDKPAAAKTAWPLSYVIPSVLLSLGAGVLLIWHVAEPARQIDAWTVTLLVVGFLPWLRTIFETIEFPGGGSVKYRKLKVEQERQGDEIRTLQFLTANFVTEAERWHLEKLAARAPFQLRPDMPDAFYDEIRRLRALGFIRQTGEMGVRGMRERQGDVKDFFEISDRGKMYLDLLAAIGEQVVGDN